MKEERTKSGLGAGLEGFFQDLRVVELAGVLAGPAVGMFFAELGARVIKIENSRTGGDITRQWKLSAEPEDSSVSAYYCSVNWNKEVRLLDLETREAQVEVHELVAGADLVISNFKPDSARRLRMDADTLRDLNGRLIYAQIDAFGPDEQRPAFDVVLQAEAGYLYMSGEPGRPPVKMPVALIDLLAAHQLKEAVLVALLQRERSGKGCTVRTSLFESALASLANQATNWLMGGLVPQPIGTQHPNIAPYGDIVHTADGKPLVLAAGTDRQFAALCHCLGLPELVADERFADNASRVCHREALLAEIQSVVAGRSREDWVQAFLLSGVPAGCIRDMREVFELPAAQAMILTEPLPDGRVSRRVRTVAFEVGE